MVVVQVDFGAALVAGILAGRKTATTRWRPAAVAVPQVAQATSGGLVFAELELVSATETTRGALAEDADLLRCEDVASGEELVGLLDYFYPRMPREASEPLTAFRFRLVRPIAPPQPPAGPADVVL